MGRPPRSGRGSSRFESWPGNLITYLIRSLLRAIGNGLRRMGKTPDYVLLVLDGEYPEIKPSRQTPIERFSSKKQLSLAEIVEIIDLARRDSRVKGVVLHIRGIRMTFAQIESVRAALERLREAGKRLISWSTTYSSSGYLLAASSDRILLQGGGFVEPLGLRAGFVFLADGLARAGLKADFVQITPYKSAADPLMRSEMSPEVRDMNNWLIDDVFETYVGAIAKGRGKDRQEVLTLIDATPMSDAEAVQTGVVDEILDEEALPQCLGNDAKPARLVHAEAAKKKLLRPRPPRPGKYIALLKVEGTIVDGVARRPPFRLPLPVLGGPTTGDLTFVHQARKVMKDRRAAGALVLIDSGGGSATSSEAMSKALEKIAAKKPVVAYMASVAASGGYWVSLPAHWVVAQPTTITGSIGVLSGKIINSGLYEKLAFNRDEIERGRHIGMNVGNERFTDEERAIVWKLISSIYDHFLVKVSARRNMTREEVDAVGGGRVWTGRQALERGLIDELGDYDRAVQKVRELAKLSANSKIRPIKEPKKPTLVPESKAVAAMEHVLEAVGAFDGKVLCISPLVRVGRTDFFG